MKKRVKVSAPAAPLRLDLGCGPNPREGFEGVDRLPFGQKHVVDLRESWPWPEGSVAEAHTSHTVEHFTARERVHFWNELWRVLALGAKCQVIVPDWSSARAYGDPTHQWPPFSSFALYYLSREWRLANAPHADIGHSPDGLACNFAAMGGGTMNPACGSWNQERQQYAQTWYKDAVWDLVFTLEKQA